MSRTRSAAFNTGARLALIAGAAMGGCSSLDLTGTEPAPAPVAVATVPIDIETSDPTRPQYSTVDLPSAPYDPFLVAGGVLATREESAFAVAPPPAPKSQARGRGSAGEVIRLNPVHPPAVKPANDATNLYGEIMATASDGRATGNASRAGGANFSQVSFAVEGSDFDPCVSRDGSQIVFASTQHSANADIYIKALNSRVVTRLTNDAGNDVMPQISPDGERIAFSSNRNGNWDIFVMPINGGRAIQVSTAGADELHPSWSPDGSQLVYCRMGEVSGQWELWVSDAFNAGVSKFIGFGLFPNWCPVAGTGADGADRILFQRSRERGDRSFGVWTLDYKEGQAGNATELASVPGSACINPAWSPDGQWIAYATVTNPGEWARAAVSRPASGDLWMMDIQAATRIKLTNAEALNLMPTWSANNVLVFVSDRGGVDNLWSMNLTGAVQLASAGLRDQSKSAHANAKPATKTPVKTASVKQPKESSVANAEDEHTGDEH